MPRPKLIPPVWTLARQPALAWLLVVGLLAVLTSATWSVLPVEVSGSVAALMQEMQQPVSKASGPEALAGIAQLPRSGDAYEPWSIVVKKDNPATAPRTPRIFLPFTLSGHTQVNSPFGVQLYGSQPSVPKRVDQAGASWIRIPLNWSEIEPANTVPEFYTWPGYMDELLAKLSARDVRAILTLSENPSWAATYPGGPVDLVDIGELKQFLTAAVGRYGAPPYNVKHWEMYNEPDNGDRWHAQNGYGYFGNQPRAYYDLLKAIYRPVKAVDPEAQIVFGGLAYDNWNDGENGLAFVRDFLDKVLELGGAKYFDFMNFHYYPIFAPVWDPYGPGIIGKATFLRDKLAEYGVDKPFICTEAGMWSDAAHGGSNALQSRYVAQVYARSAAAELKPTIWFQFTDGDNLGTWKFGLVNSDLSPKPSYSAYQTAAQQLASAQYFRTLDHDETGTDQMEAYEFLTPSRSTRIVVAWTNDELEHPLVLQTQQVISVTKYGEQTVIDDIDDGISDGRVELTVGPSPVYLRFKP